VEQLDALFSLGKVAVPWIATAFLLFELVSRVRTVVDCCTFVVRRFKVELGELGKSLRRLVYECSHWTSGPDPPSGPAAPPVVVAPPPATALSPATRRMLSTSHRYYSGIVAQARSAHRAPVEHAPQ
jgi:hypothetical protein